MPSTRKQKAEERRSRQLDIMSDVENVVIMLGSCSRDDDRNNQSEYQIQDAITTTIAEKVLPSIQNTLSEQGKSNFTVEDRRSSGLQKSPEAVSSQKAWEDHP